MAKNVVDVEMILISSLACRGDDDVLRFVTMLTQIRNKVEWWKHSNLNTTLSFSFKLIVP